MEIFKYLIEIVKKNLVLLIGLIVVFGIAGFVHYKFQKKTYVSHFTVTKGGVDYEIFSDIIHFNSYHSNAYSLPEQKLEEIKSQLSAFTVSYLEGSPTTINFTLVSSNPNADHEIAQNNVLELLNSSIYLANTVKNDIRSLEAKSNYLDDKLTLLDSAMVSEVGSIGEDALSAYTLFELKTEIESELNGTGTFEIIKPVGDASEKSKPLTVFVVLYEVLAALLFLFLARLSAVYNPS